MVEMTGNGKLSKVILASIRNQSSFYLYCRCTTAPADERRDIPEWLLFFFAHGSYPLWVAVNTTGGLLNASSSFR